MSQVVERITAELRNWQSSVARFPGQLYNPLRLVGGRSHYKQDVIHKSNKRIVYIRGGTRAGKTKACAAEAARRLYDFGAYNPYIAKLPEVQRGDIFVFSPSRDVQKGPGGVQEQLLEMIPEELIVHRAYATPLALSEIHVKDGDHIHVCQFKTHDMDVEKIQSVKLAFGWMDEQPREDHFDQMLMRLTDLRGKALISMMPTLGYNWTQDRFEGNPQVETVVMSQLDNPYLPREAIEDNLRMYASDDKRTAQLIYGEYTQRTGLMVPQFSRQTHVKTWQDFKRMTGFECPQPDWIWVMAGDYGYNHNSAYLWLVQDLQSNVWAVKLIWQNETLPDIYAEMIEKYEMEIKKEPDIRVHDRTRPDIIEFYANSGIFFSPAQQDNKTGIEKIRQYFANNRLYLIGEECEGLIWELLRWYARDWASNRARQEKPGQDEGRRKDDDAIDALRYGLAEMPEPPEAQQADNLITTTDPVSRLYWERYYNQSNRIKTDRIYPYCFTNAERSRRIRSMRCH